MRASERDDDKTIPVPKPSGADLPPAVPAGSESASDVTVHVDPNASEQTRPSLPAATSAPILRIGRYDVVRELGRGGMGVVYLAEDRDLKRPVALKVLSQGFAGIESLRARFRREAETASRLNHKNLCGVHAIGEENGCDWIAMRYVAGRTLTQELNDARRAEQPAYARAGAKGEDKLWRHAVRLVETIARALHAAHESGVVHRDMKPSNIMIEPSGEPVILDFGLAHDLSSEGAAQLTQSGDVLGTPHYMAPEQILGRAHQATAAVDIWALGVILFEVLTLGRPFEGPTRDALYRSILADEPSNALRRRRGVPRDLDVVLRTALEKVPAKRYQSALALADDLLAVLEIRPIKAEPPSVLTRTIKWARRRPATAIFLATMLVVLPITASLVVSSRLESGRVRAAAAGHLDDARAALAKRDGARARAALSQAGALGAATATVAAIEAELDRLATVEKTETICLDADADPEGRSALAHLDELAARAPEDLERLGWRAYVLIRTGREEAARALLEAGKARHGESAASKLATSLLGDRADTASRPASADEAVADPDDPLALFAALGRSARRDHRTALRMIEAMMIARPEAHWLAWSAAEEATRLQEYHAALALAQHHRAAVGAFGPERRARYSVHLRRAGQAAHALAEALAAAQAAPESVVVGLSYANALDECGRHDEARSRFQALSEAHPESPEVWSALGNAVLERAMSAAEVEVGPLVTAAIEDYEKALRLRPNAADAMLGLGNAHYMQGNLDQAEKILRKALEHQPDFPFALNSLGVVLRQTKRLDEARDVLERILIVKPNYPEGLLNLGTVYDSLGQSAAAERMYRRVLEMNPNITAAMYSLARLVRDRDANEGERLYRRVIELEPNRDDAMLNLANMLMNAEKHDEALALMRTACEMNPKQAMNWLNRGAACSGLGRNDEAIECFRQAAVLDPLDYRAQNNLMLLLAKTDPLEALARFFETQRMNAELRERFRTVLGQVLASHRQAGDDHILVESAQALLSTDAEERLEIVQDVLQALPRLADGRPSDRDFAIKRATVENAREAAATLADRSLRLRLDEEAARLDGLAAAATQPARPH